MDKLKIKNLTNKPAFTLVELIIVITILAILATIAFISFKNYSGNARDGNKLTTLSNIENGLNLYQVKTGSYPTPDDIYGSGNYSGTLLSQVGFVGTGVIQAINMNTVPKDPTVNFGYSYGLTHDNRYYQVATALESNQTSFINQTYANNYTSKVVGNYKGLYKFSTGGVNYIMNLPSLIFTQTGTIQLENPVNPKFVINNGGNLVKPYDNNNRQEVTAVLEKLTGTGVSLTGIIIPTTFEEWKTQSGNLQNTLGYSPDDIGVEIYGKEYASGNSNLQVITPPAPVVYASCSFSGNTITHGSSVTAYETTSVTYGNTCTSEQRTCNDGVLSGGFENASCNVDGATGTFTLSANTTPAGQPITITNNCSVAPTSYSSSNGAVAVTSGNNVLAIEPGTTIITPIGGACADNTGKTLTVTAQPTYQLLCSASGQIIYTNDTGSEIGRINNAGTTTSGTPGNLTTSGHIVVCTGNQTGYVLKSVNEGASTVGALATTTSYGNYYQFGKSDNSRVNGNESYNYDWKSPGGTDSGSANDWGVTNATAATATWANSTEANKIKMIGPCPTGYHVPTRKEWNDVITAWGGGNNGTNLSNALKLPLSGFRRNNNGTMGAIGSDGMYWTSSPSNANAYDLYLSTSNIYPGNDPTARAIGISVRCFKN